MINPIMDQSHRSILPDGPGMGVIENSDPENTGLIKCVLRLNCRSGWNKL